MRCPLSQQISNKLKGVAGQVMLTATSIRGASSDKTYQKAVRNLAFLTAFFYLIIK